MSRLLAQMRHDFRLQRRNGFWHAAAFVAILAIVGLRFVPGPAREIFLPALVLSNLLMGTFYFIAGLVMLERGDGSLQALVVTPLRPHEYLTSKVATLSLLAVVENLAIVRIAHGGSFDPVLLTLGIAAGAGLYTLLGFIAVAPYRVVNEYLLASMAWVIFLSLPFVHYAGLWPDRWWSGLFWLHPLQPSLSLLAGAFRPPGSIELAYALVYGGLWVAYLIVRARAGFRQFVIGEQPA